MNVLPHLMESKTVLDSGFRAVDSGFQIPHSRCMDSRFLVSEIPIVTEWNSGFLELYSGFQIPGFWIPEAKMFRIPLNGVKRLTLNNAVVLGQKKTFRD